MTNSGPDATNAPVAVTDALPSGLTATDIAGPGWNCVLATLTCTRSDALAANASYPNITLTVNVANNAPANVINSGTVTGGGDPTPNTDVDPTDIGTDVNLAIDKSHSGNFRQGQTGAQYTIVGDQQRTERHNRPGVGHRRPAHRADRNCDQRHRLELRFRNTDLHPQ